MILRAVALILQVIGGLLIVFVCAVAIYNYFVHYQSRLDGWPPRSAFAPPVDWSPQNPQKVRILAIDGGGMHGLATLEILRALEQKAGRPLPELFDFVAGTSTGSIIAALLLLPDENGKPRFSVDDVIAIYEDLSQRIFRVPWYHRLLTVNGLMGPLFLNHGRFIESSEFFRGYSFGELIRPAMVPTYSRATSSLHLVMNFRDVDANLNLGPLIAAATSAQSIFPGVQLQGHIELEGMYDDAGMILNNPAHKAFEVALLRNPNSEIVVVSVGTNFTEVVTPDVDVYGGMVQWAIPMLHIITKGQAGVSTASLDTLEEVAKLVNLDAYRLAAPLSPNLQPFDASKSNIDNLKKAGRDYVSSSETELTETLKALGVSDHDQTGQMPSLPQVR
jgi:predicted acylesterase/phospholipase RssA